jgi:O-antigen ligase
VWGFVNVARPEIVADPFSSSTAGRLVLGVAGMELFYDSPIVGVGWRQSSNPELIASPEVIGPLRAQFPGVSRNLFPNTTVETGVHNAYIQVLAELGLIGAGLSLFAAFKLNRRLKRMPRDPLGNFYRLALFGILVWWNDNPLYGGQTESISFFLLIGAALAHQNVTPAVSTQRSVGTVGAAVVGGERL